MEIDDQGVHDSLKQVSREFRYLHLRFTITEAIGRRSLKYILEKGTSFVDLDGTSYELESAAAIELHGFFINSFDNMTILQFIVIKEEFRVRKTLPDNVYQISFDAFVTACRAAKQYVEKACEFDKESQCYSKRGTSTRVIFSNMELGNVKKILYSEDESMFWRDIAKQKFPVLNNLKMSLRRFVNAHEPGLKRKFAKTNV